MKIRDFKFFFYLMIWFGIASGGIVLNNLMMRSLEDLIVDPFGSDGYRLFFCFLMNWWLFLMLFLSVCVFGLYTVWNAFRMRRTMDVVSSFANSLAAGDNPAPLQVRNVPPAMKDIFLILNFLRDRQNSLAGKLRVSVARETEIRREVENYDSLQLRLMLRILPEMRIPLAAIKGFALMQLADVRENRVAASSSEALLSGIAHKVALLSRDIERLQDIGSLGRDNLTAMEFSEVNILEFVRGLIDLNTIPLREREVMLLNRISSSAPECIRVDRAKLMQMLSMMVRIVGLCVSPGAAVSIGCSRRDGTVIFEVFDNRTGECREDPAAQIAAYEARRADGADGGDMTVSVMSLLLIRDTCARLNAEFDIGATADSYLMLRLSLPDSCVCESFSETVFARSGGGKPDPENSGNARRQVLLVGGGEDERIFRRMLGLENITVDAVGSEPEIPVYCEKYAPDGIVFISAPEENKFDELSARLRSIPRCREIPLVIISAVVTDSSRLQIAALPRVYLMNMPVNYKLVAGCLRS